MFNPFGYNYNAMGFRSAPPMSNIFTDRGELHARDMARNRDNHHHFPGLFSGEICCLPRKQATYYYNVGSCRL